MSLVKRFSFMILAGALLIGLLQYNIHKDYILRKQQQAVFGSLLRNTDFYNKCAINRTTFSNNNTESTWSPQPKEEKSAKVLNPTLMGTETDNNETRRSTLSDVLFAIAQFTHIENRKYLESLREALSRLPKLPSVPQNISKKTNYLQTTMVPPLAWMTYPRTSWYGMLLPVITSEPAGRTGNIMGEYATLYALHHLYNVSVVVTGSMKEHLGAFPRLSLPRIPEQYTKTKWQKLTYVGSLYNYAPLELAAAGLLGPGLFALRDTAFEIQLFKKFKKNLQQEFSFSDAISIQASAFLQKVKILCQSRGNMDPVFVSFHIRRTDYRNHAEKHFGAALPEKSYFVRAMRYYRDKFPNRAVFIVASDDTLYVKREIGNMTDVFLSGGSSPALDMAILSSCNHSIVTMGSFGFWTGFLAGGEVVYPDVKYKKLYRFSRQMYERIGLENFTALPVD